MDKKDYFTKRFISLLLRSQTKDNPADLPRGRDTFSSISDIFSSKKYLKHWERKLNGNNK